MRLAVFVDQVFWRDGPRLKTNESYILFPASFVDYVDEIIFIGREATGDSSSAPYVLDNPKFSLVSLPYYPNLYKLWRANPAIYPQIMKTIRAHAAEWDAILISGPHPIGQLIARQCAALGVTVIPMVRQNLIDQMSAHGNIALRTVAQLVAAALEWDFKQMSRGRTVLTVGMEMKEVYGKYSDRTYNHFPCLVDQKQFEMFSSMTPGSDPTRLLCVCRLSPEKGHKYLFEALDKLRSEGLICHVDVVGGGDSENELKALVSKLGLDQQVTFHGYVAYGPPLFSLYLQAGAMVLSSLTEGFPQVINESLSIGLPTICSAVGGIPSFVTNNETGLLVPPGDVPALAAAIKRVATDKDLRERLSRNGRALMKDNTLEANRSRVLHVIEEEVRAKAQPHGDRRPVPLG
jgi:glycosyltransferase involved in cell wall biosynthesis